ncbi:MAG: RdgB/HAM1 family non-canonical purine NTP pyrophosphatase [Acidaminococcales bacterium]|jgi:XTP/dITP diphosphohydrolase|nr:RdgB/HAM1 family non-canonical purine NTP pyrophosphatase [Acidaminococcales bacterium]
MRTDPKERGRRRDLTARPDGAAKPAIKKLLAATGNAGKAREFARLLKNRPFSLLTLADWPDIAAPEETGLTFLENAKAKAGYYARLTGECCVADDSGLEVYALGGAPGVMSARYAGEKADDEENNRLLLQNMADKDDRACRFVCAVALSDAAGGIIFSAVGETEGTLLREGRGGEGFGYDPLFFVPALGKTLAEASPQEKDAISHRGRALAALLEFLQSSRLAGGAGAD